MSDDQKKARLHQASIRGRNAEDVLSNSAYQEAHTALRAHLFQRFTKAEDDPEALVTIRRELRALDDVQKRLEYFMKTGRVAEKTLAEKFKEFVS